MPWSDRKSVIGNWNSSGGKAKRRARRRDRWKRLIKCLCGVALGLAVLVPISAVSAPKQLYGKSVTVSWGEARSQRLAGEQAFRSANVSLQRSIYISTAGRVFSRLSSTASMGRRSRSGQAEGVGTGGKNFSGGARDVRFQGNSMNITTGFTASARQIVINFDSGFGSCSARVITAKQVGAKTASWRGIAGGGVKLEVESVSAGAASCSIRDGNVFAQ